MVSTARHWCREMRIEEGADEIVQPDGFERPCIQRIDYLDDAWWANNHDDAATMIFFCPFCGCHLNETS